MFYKNKVVNNPIKSTFNDLKLFEQNNYCYNFIKSRFPSKSDDEIINHSEISAACFRQAFEYYNAANSVSIATSPLLYSYSLNNLLKGVCYLISFDDEILDKFKAHGFKVDSSYLDKVDISKSKVTIMQQKGAVHSLLKLYDNSLCKQEISISKILRHIPDIDDVYFRSLNSISFIARDKKNGSSNYYIYGDSLDNDSERIIKMFSLSGSINPRSNEFICYTTLGTNKLFDSKKIQKENVYYKSYLNIPDEFVDGMKDLNVAFYCYLLIMTYGMMVRYNANKWENYTDKKTSKHSTLIEQSIPNSVHNFFFQMHYLIFGFYYESNTYDAIKIKELIKDSTTNIMNDITNKIISDNYINNTNNPLPWREHFR